MAIDLKVAANCDDCYLVWKPQEDIPDCLGFALYRKRNGGPPELLKNRVGFDDNLPENATSQPSTAWPFQRLSWADHGGNTGDTLSYRVVAMVGTKDSLKEGLSSGWSKEVTLTADCGDGLSAYFNRGFVISQFMGRIMRERGWKPKDIKAHAGMLQDNLREFLGGDLKQAIVALLNEACQDSKIQAYAALFEATDDELNSKLEFLGPRLHIVLGNGAVQNKGDDENKDLRKALQAAKADLYDRMSAPTFLAHNKFVVLCRNNKPVKVWTGSTNWQPTGLCTQVNNGILIENADIAQDYLDAWNRLKDAGNGHPKEFKTANSSEPTERQIAQNISASARFTATAEQVDISQLLDLIDHAQHSILFEMFAPGTGIFNAVLVKANNLYVQGVANTFPNQAQTGSEVTTTLVDKRGKRDFSMGVVEPKGIKAPFAYWAAEITEKEFSGRYPPIGHAIVHSKVLVLDVGTVNPVVVTGSHNFSNSASQKNDENFIVIRGSAALARAYAVNCLGVYDHYRWREYVAKCVAQGKTPWSKLSSAKTWLSDYMKAPEHQALLKFWFD